jgi:hypothetical protein
MDISSIVTHTIRINTVYDDGKKHNEVYRGTNKGIAEALKTFYGKEHVREWEAVQSKVIVPTLPENRFKVIKTEKRGTILVVPSEDFSDRCLIFVGCSGGYEGGVSLLGKDTTATILKMYFVGNEYESRIETIALMDVGQKVAFHIYSKLCGQLIYDVTWTGESYVESLDRKRD